MTNHTTTAQALDYIARQYFTEPDDQHKAINAMEEAIEADRNQRSVALVESKASVGVTMTEEEVIYLARDIATVSNSCGVYLINAQLLKFARSLLALSQQPHVMDVCA